MVGVHVLISDMLRADELKGSNVVLLDPNLQAAEEVSSLRTVGLCHGLFATYTMLERIFNVKEEDIAVKFGGVNHFYWVLDFTIKGKPGYPELHKLLKTKTLNELIKKKDTDATGFVNLKYTLCDELFRQYACVPYPGDRHSYEGLSGYINNTKKRLGRFDLNRTTITERIKHRGKAREHTLQLASEEEKPFGRSRETAIDIMSAFIANKPFIDVVNLPNVGQISNLPMGAVVETMGTVDAMGFTPVAMHIKALVEPSTA